jgi:hypothetical protein
MEAGSSLAEFAPLILAAEGGLDLASAANGWDVPKGTLTMLHPREMVLPAHLAENVRNMTGKGGGETHIHIHAVDGKSVERLFMNHTGALSRSIQRAVRDGSLTVKPGKR